MNWGGGGSGSLYQAGHNWIYVPVVVVLTVHPEDACGHLALG